VAGSFPWRASVAYVTGAHSVKVGYQGTYNVERSGVGHERSESHVPFQQRRAEPAHRVHLAVEEPLACRVARALRQEQWTFRRLTLQGALRFDRATSWYLDQQVDRRGSCRSRLPSPRPME